MYDFEDTKTAKGNNKKHIMRVNWKAEIEMKNFSLDNTFCRKKSDDYGGMQLLWIFFILKFPVQFQIIIGNTFTNFFRSSSSWNGRYIRHCCQLLMIALIVTSQLLIIFFHTSISTICDTYCDIVLLTLSSQLLKMLWNLLLKCI